MQYRLRTLLIAVGIGPPVLALVWWAPWLFPVTMVWSIAALIPLAILEEFRRCQPGKPTDGD